MSIVAACFKNKHIPTTVLRAPVVGFMLFVIVLVIGFSTTMYAQIRTITGKVTESANNNALGGVKITGKGTRAGAFTKKDGTYSLAVPTDTKVLVFEYVGYKKKEFTLTSSDEVNIQLAEDVLKLEELVVTAVGITQEKKTLTYAVQEVKSKDIESSRQTNILNALAGQVSGVQINSSSGTPGAATFVRVRGFASVTGSNQPLIVVDGVPISNNLTPNNGGSVGGVDQSNGLNDINPDDVESISVLKGAAATALYGLQAGAGAILITTKKGKEDVSAQVNYSFTKTFSQTNQEVPLQKSFIQGSRGLWNAPHTYRSQSWGPKVDTVFWDGSTYPWDNNGMIIGKSAAAGNSRAKQFTPYDNWANFFVTGQTDIHSLSVSGGSSVAKYYFSINDSKDKGVVPNSTFDRTTVRLNVDYNLSAQWTVGTNVQYIRSLSSRPERGSNVGGVMLGLLRTPISFDNAGGTSNPATHNSASHVFPAGTIYDGQDLTGLQRAYRGVVTDDDIYYYAIYDNPFWVVTRNLFNDQTDRTQGSVWAQFLPGDWFGREILGDVKVKYTLGGDFVNTKANQGVSIGSANAPSGSVFEVEQGTQWINSDLLVTVNRELGTDLNATLILGHNLFQRRTKFFSAFATKLAVPEFYNLSNAADAPTLNRTSTIKRTSALFGDLTLDYKNMVTLNFKVRNENSTALPEANNSFTYGGASVSLVLSELLNLDQNDIYAKLRGSFARIGQDTDPYSLQTPFTRAVATDGWVNFGATFPINGVTGFQKVVSLGGGDVLKPESSSQIEVGAELKFLQNRLSFDIAYYTDTRSDLILPVPIANSSGFDNRIINAAEMKNEGIDVVANANLVREPDSGLNVDLTLNFSTFKNTVTKLADGVKNIFIGGFSNGAYAEVGSPYGTLYGTGWKRNAEGKPIIGEDGYPMETDTLRGWGANIPDWTAGVRLTASWKGLTISGLLDIKKGGKMWNGTRAALNTFGMSKDTENRGKMGTVVSGGLTIVDGVFDGVKDGTVGANNSGGTKNDVAAFRWNEGQYWYGNLGIFNTFNSSLMEPFIEDAGWVRLREVTLSYDLPNDVISFVPILRSFQIFGSARNLWLSTDYTGVDPETSLTGARNAQGLDYFNNPGTKSYSFGIRVGF